MSYAPQTWADNEGGGTPLTAARLNHIEDGLDAVPAMAAGSTVLTFVSSTFASTLVVFPEFDAVPIVSVTVVDSDADANGVVPRAYGLSTTGMTVAGTAPSSISASVTVHWIAVEDV